MLITGFTTRTPPPTATTPTTPTRGPTATEAPPTDHMAARTGELPTIRIPARMLAEQQHPPPMASKPLGRPTTLTPGRMERLIRVRTPMDRGDRQSSARDR